MTTLLDELKGRLSKARAKVERHEKALESARSEVADMMTALRVIQAMSSESSSAQSSQPVATRQRDILGTLSESSDASQAPAEIFETYKLIYDPNVSLETFRTTVWRMSEPDKRFTIDGETWRVNRADGRYWKEKISPLSASEGLFEVGREAELEGPEKTVQRPFRNGENVGSSPTPPAPNPSDPWQDQEDDSDVPF